MTTREAIVELWTLAGEPSDLDPILAGATDNDPANVDPAAYGTAHYLREINNLQVLLTNWRTSRGRPIRFDKFLVQKNAKLGMTTTVSQFDVTELDSTTLRIDTFPAWMTEDILESAKIVLTQEGTTATEDSDNMVMSATIAGANMELFLRDEVLAPAFVVINRYVTVSFDRYTIDRAGAYTNGAYLVLPDTLRNVTKITTAEGGDNLKMVHSKDDLYDPFVNTGTPSEYYILGDKVYFDQYLEGPTWFIFEYQRLPIVLTAIDQAMDVPVEWHPVLMAIGEWRSSKRLQDMEKDMILKSQVNQLINQMRTDAEEAWLRQPTGGFYVAKEAR